MVLLTAGLWDDTLSVVPAFVDPKLELPSVPVPVPILLGLAARGGGDRETAVDRLATELEAFVSARRSDRTDEGGGDQAAGVNFDIDRTDDIGRLATAIEDLTGIVEDREQRLAERERELQQSEGQFDALVDDPKLLVGLLEPDGTLRRANQTAAEYVDTEVETVIGEPFERTPWWRDTPKADVREWIDRAAAGEYVEYEASLDGPDGTRNWVGGTFRPVTTDEGEVIAIIVSARDITDQKERERQLRDREEKLQRYKSYTDEVLDAVDDVFYVFDRNGELQRWNESLPEATGYTDEEIASMNPLDFFDGEDRAEIETAIEEIFETGELRVEAQISTADGEQIPYEFVATRLEDLDGNQVITGIGRDISERRAKERELERYREFTDDMLDAIDDVFYVLEADGEMVRWNETVAAVSGYAHEEIASMNALDFFPEDEQPAIRASMEEAFETGTTRVEAEYLTKDGERIPYEFVATVLEDPDGNPVEVGIGRDISERRERENALRERERELSTLMSNVPGMVYRCRNEPDWPFEFVSDGSADLTGHEPAELVDGDVNWGDDVLIENHDELWETVQEALDERDSFQVTYPIETADGERRWLSERGRGVFDEDGTVEALEGVITDVTDRIENERELERTTRLLEQAEQLANVGAWELDVRTEPYELQWTDEVHRIHGVSPDAEIDVETAIEFYHPEDRPKVERALERAIEAGEPYDLELRIVPDDDDDGGHRWVRTIGDPIAVDGEVVTIHGSFQDITDRKRRERELERYETIIQAIGDPVYTLDASGEFRFMNDAIESLAGYDPETVIGEPVSEFMQPSDLERAQELVRELLREDEPYETFEMALETASGDVIEAENHVALLPMDDGEFAGTAGVVRDITDRKERERDLERTTELLEQAQRIAGVGGWELDVTTDPYELTLTSQLQRLFGRDDPSERSRDVAAAVQTYHPDDRPRILSAVEDAVERGESYDLEVRMYMADGEERWMRTIGEPIEADGEVVAIRGSVQDITERKERERDLERTRDLLERTQRMARVGGWELNMQSEPRTAIWTDELYRLHDLPRDIDPDLETTLACYHPDDRPFVRERLETAMAEEAAYDLEARLQTDAGDIRWVQTMGEPIHDDDGTLETFRGSVQDITDRKRRELALESLHETARGLLDAETEATVAELVVETATELLETDDATVAVYLLDSETNRFEPVASTPAFASRSGDPPSVAVGDTDSVLWTTYVAGTQTVVDDAAIGDDGTLFGDDAPGGLLVPIGDHGVFVLAAPPATIDEETRQLFETLVATTETAFDRLESEATLRERDAELEARNRRLRRQIQITEIIRGIDRSLIGADGRSEIERTVPDQLIEADTVDFAWIGDLGAGGTELEPRTWAGSDPEYLDALTFDLEGDSSEPAVRTARSETPTLAENVVEGLQKESWRTTALDAGFQSVLAVPLAFEEYSYGVLTVYSEDPDAFSDLEETVFAELGEGIANAINAAETQEALHAETLVELTLGLEGDDLLSRIASATGGTVTYEGLGTHSGPETVLFFETSGVSPTDVRAVLEDFVSVADAQLIADSDDGCLFEATVTGETIASRLVRHGGSPRAITADGDRTTITVDVPTTTDVREFVEMLDDRYAGAELEARRHVQRAMHTRQELVTSLFETLTDRQLEVLRTAYLAGFFEWPRESTGEEIAELLGVTQPTVNRHLRIGQQRLLDRLFENETLSLGEES